ncbi:hypothetical protein ECG_05468 [Echinococcus granulosus]|nr:hypothetical protein ECG_05468 [Echinococcus granulosus]
MDACSKIFAFDSNLLSKDGTERCFEMSKADKYALRVNEHQAIDNSSLFWLFGEETFPEMRMTIRLAKINCGISCSWECTEGSVAELIFHNIALRKEIQSLNEENANLKEENNHLRQMQSGIPKTVEAVSDQLTTSVSDVNMSSVCDDTVSTYYNPVPGVNTILSCVEREVPIDTGPTPTLTVNVRQKMDQIRQMFYEDDSERQHQETLTIKTSTVGGTSIASTPKPSTPLYIHKDVPLEVLPGRCLGGLQTHKDESPPLQFVRSEKPLGLQIFKDPEGLAACETEPKRPRQPLRTITQTSPLSHPPPPSSDEENLGFVAVTRAAARIDSAGATVPTFTLPIVFDPPCASTSVFTRSLAPSPPSAPLNPSTRVQPEQPQQLKAESDHMVLEMNSPPPSPSRPNTPLADAFSKFVHSPDARGRLRIDATKFIDAFLSTKAVKTKDSENKRPPIL